MEDKDGLHRENLFLPTLHLPVVHLLRMHRIIPEISMTCRNDHNHHRIENPFMVITWVVVVEVVVEDMIIEAIGRFEEGEEVGVGIDLAVVVKVDKLYKLPRQTEVGTKVEKFHQYNNIDRPSLMTVAWKTATTTTTTDGWMIE